MGSTLRGPDASLSNMPVCNYFIMLLITACFAIQSIWDPGAHHLNVFVLKKWSFCGMLGHSWLQMNSGHLIESLATLWIFGRHVSIKMRKRVYLLAYILLGIAAAVVHLLYDGRPVIGASGAIMGIMGLHMVICFNRFSRIGPWLIISWLCVTLVASVSQTTAIAHMEHFGGFLCGMLLGLFLMCISAANCDDTDPGLRRLIARLRPCAVAA